MKVFYTGLTLATALFALSAVSARTGVAQEVTLTSNRDNTLIESATGANSNAQGTGFIAGRTNQGADPRRRAVIGFDIAAAIPADSTIESVTLTLTRTGGNPPANVLSLHRLVSDWGEGTSSFEGGPGSPSTVGDATWIHAFFDTTPWTPGGDFDPAASATAFSVTPLTVDNDVYTWSSSGMQSDVQGWLDDPDQEFGWILIGDESVMMTTIQFASREHLTSGFRPALQVVYSPEPTTLLLQAVSLFTLAAIARARSARTRAARP